MVLQCQSGPTAAVCVNVVRPVLSLSDLMLQACRNVGVVSRLELSFSSLNTHSLCLHHSFRCYKLFYQAWKKLKIISNILNLNSHLNSFWKQVKMKSDSLSRGKLLSNRSQCPKGTALLPSYVPLSQLNLPIVPPSPSYMVDDLA